MWGDRRKLESRKITLTHALTKIEAFRKRMLASYGRLLDERVPIQRYAKLVMHLLLYRLHVMILHPYYANTTSTMPARLRTVLVMSGIMIIELAMQLDTNPAFRPWRWYAGAYQQYQAALILATEIYYHPAHKEAGRVWACLDYVFGLDDNMPKEEKGRQILADIMEKMNAYMKMRKMRAPALTAGASPAEQAVKGEEAMPRTMEETGNASRPPLSQQTYPQMRNTCPPMKEELGDVPPPVGLGPRSGASFHSSNSGTPASVSPPPLPPPSQQQQMMISGTGSSPIHAHSQRGTLAPHVVMASHSSEQDLWGLPPPPFNQESPENSSSDGGPAAGVEQVQGSSGGVGTSVSGGGAPPHLMEGEWVRTRTSGCPDRSRLLIVHDVA